MTYPAVAAQSVTDQIAAHMRGEKLENLVDFKRGY
jgi:hypothetical protein